jgi:AraC-like DNA-binding protein
MAIEDIFTSVGYSHPSNFVKAFKKTYKKTPLKYRREKT